MDGFIHPLDHRAYSWLLSNHSRATNSSYLLPFTIPTPPLQEEEWLTLAAEGSESYFNSAFQDLSLGFLSIFMLQKKFKGFDFPHRHGILLLGKCDLTIYNAILTNILKSVVGLVLMLISLPIVLPIVSLFWLMTAIVKAIYAFQFKLSASKAEGMDGVWGLETKESRPFIITCLMLSGEPDVERIRQHIITKVLNIRDESGEYKFKKFHQTFSQLYGYYMWRDVEAFDIKDHVRVIDLQKFYQQEPRDGDDSGRKFPQKGDVEEGVSEKQIADDLLYKFLSEESATALSSDRSPWEVLLLLRGDGSYNVVIRLHHAIGDGISMMRVCMETLVDTPLTPPSVGHRRGNAFVRAAMMVWSAMVLPFGLLQVVANFDNNVLHGRPLSGKKVIASSRGLPLPILKKIKLAAGATVNDVLMSCLSAALSKHFSRKSEVIGQVTAVVPVSFHDLRAPVALTNQFSVATVKLPTSCSHTSDSRLKATKALLDGMKRDPTVLAVFSVVRAVSHVLPAPVAELLLSGRGVTVAASNVPGPQQEVTIWGDKLEDIQFWVPNRAPVGVGVSFASYRGVVKVGLNVDAALVESREEAQQLLDDVEAEMYALHSKLVLRG